MTPAFAATLIVAVIGVVGAIGAPFLARRLTSSQAAAARALATKTEAEAEAIRLGTARDAADYVRDVALKAQRTADEAHRLRLRIRAIEEAAREHGEWDQLMVNAMREMRDRITEMGAGSGMPVLPDPPPLVPPDLPELS